MRIPLAKHFYQLDSKPLSAQECVNMFFEPTVGEAKSDGALYGVDGLDLFLDLGNSPIYGLYQMNDYVYAVSGDNVYSIDQYAGYSNLGSLGSVSSSVIMADNDTHVVIVPDSGVGYLATPSSLTQITDGDFQSSSSVTVLDYFGIFPKTGTAQYYISDLNDLTSYDPLKFNSAESTSDNIVRAFAFNDELWLFKGSATEVHYNAGGGGIPFVVRQNATLQRGCGAKKSVAQEDNTIFWLGDDNIVYRADGYRPQRISTYAIEREISTYTTTSDAEAFVFTSKGHKFFIITFPSANRTWAYDITTGLWHRRKSYGKERWIASSHTRAFGKNLIGDYQTGKIYSINPNTYTENGTTIESKIVLPVIFDNGKRNIIASIRLDMDGGFGTSGQGENPQCGLRISRDGGYTYGNQILRPMGKTGEYTARCVWRRCGQARQPVFEFTMTDPTKRAVTGAFINEAD